MNSPYLWCDYADELFCSAQMVTSYVGHQSAVMSFPPANELPNTWIFIHPVDSCRPSLKSPDVSSWTHLGPRAFRVQQKTWSLIKHTLLICLAGFFRPAWGKQAVDLVLEEHWSQLQLPLTLRPNKEGFSHFPLHEHTHTHTHMSYACVFAAKWH